MSAATTEHLLNRGLPKWPQMYTTGVPVPQDRAKEIIRRTDTFFTNGFDGNDRSWSRWVRETLKMPEEKWGLSADELRDMFLRLERWREHFGVIGTSYVHNSWIACAFIGGPHGWCHPEGDIGFVDNVGKWPCVDDVFEDWKILAEAFPFMDVGVTLMDAEECDEGHPVVSMRILRGEVQLVDPAKEDVHKDHPRPTRSKGNTGQDLDSDMLSTVFMPARYRETGVPESWIAEWADHVKDFNPEVQARPDLAPGDAED